MNKILIICLSLMICSQVFSQTPVNDVTTPLHRLQPDYVSPYGAPKPEEVKAVLNRVFGYLDATTPIGFINEKTGAPITDLSKVDSNIILARGDFRIVSYEWGVTYAGMLALAEATGDKKYRDYVEKRLQFIGDSAVKFKGSKGYEEWEARMPLRNLISPRNLDDTGAMTAAMIKAKRANSPADLKIIIDAGIEHIMNKQYRLKDGTLARNRPLANTLWLDDMFMSLPALVQMGKMTGDKKYFDEATKQVLLFEEKMFNREKNVFMHGWVESMDEHPQFYWARANGWAFMTLAEILDVLPKEHPNYAKILDLYRRHAKGLSSYQSGFGFWHQLLDKNDSYLETSATAIYAYSYALGINRGWIGAKEYAPMTLLAWNAVTTKVNAKGQVEGTCVGTGMAFDPAFYYYRPISPFAAHGYGPVLLAGAEVLTLLKNKELNINDSALQIVEK